MVSLFLPYTVVYPFMANGIRAGDPRGFNKGRSSKFREGSRVWQTPEESRWTYQPKRCGNNNKDEDNSPKTLNDKNLFLSFNFNFIIFSKAFFFSFYDISKVDIFPKKTFPHSITLFSVFQEVFVGFRSSIFNIYYGQTKNSFLFICQRSYTSISLIYVLPSDITFL